ncbi:MAG: Rrf2 family transcriptional regulator, partial [Candidatus Cloacimonetes bacterium]|nr:Rrf2 family transcriptional regulator [Candidatus Cloacimonadota bacterium]
GDKIRQGQFEFVPARSIAQALGIAPATLTKLLNSMRNAHLIESREGAKGGIRLARAADGISLLDVLHAVEHDGPLFRQDWEVPLNLSKPTIGQRAVNTALQACEEELKQALASRNLSDLLQALD